MVQGVPSSRALRWYPELREGEAGTAQMSLGGNGRPGDACSFLSLSSSFCECITYNKHDVTLNAALRLMLFFPAFLKIYLVILLGFPASNTEAKWMIDCFQKEKKTLSLETLVILENHTIFCLNDIAEYIRYTEFKSVGLDISLISPFQVLIYFF